MKFHARLKEGGLDFISEYNADRFRQFAKDNVGMSIEIQPLTPESKRQRRFYHGAVLTLWAYLNNLDYRDSETLEFLHEQAKREWNGEIVNLDGKAVRIGRSTKQALNHGYLEKIIEYLEENYGVDRKDVLNPEHYKHFRDAIYATGKYDTYIDYLKDLNLLK